MVALIPNSCANIAISVVGVICGKHEINTILFNFNERTATANSV